MTDHDKEMDFQKQVDAKDREISRLEGRQAIARRPEVTEEIRKLSVEKDELVRQRDAIRRSLWHAAQEAERQRMIAENG